MKKAPKSSKKVEKSAPPSPEIRRLEGVFKLMNSYGVGELEVEDKAGRVHVRMHGSSPSFVSTSSAYTPMHAPASGVSSIPSLVTSSSREVSGLTSLKDAAPADAPLASNQKKMLSPFVGTFYRASNPNAAPYVKDGQTVRKGQTICIIEAMKLMNEIESDFDGKIISALVENGQPVEFGEPLFIIEV